MLRNIGGVPTNVEQHWRQKKKQIRNIKKKIGSRNRKLLEIKWNDKEPEMKQTVKAESTFRVASRAEMWRNIETMTPNVVPHWGSGGGVSGAHSVR